MRRIICIVLWLFFTMFCYAQDMAIVPTPALIKMNKGNFVFNANAIIRVDAAEDNATHFFTHYMLDTWNLQTDIKSLPAKARIKRPVIYVTNGGSEKLAPEGYRLSVMQDSIVLIGKGAGLFYGIQTLLQLLPDNARKEDTLPCLLIEDNPRFGYRGLMLDVSRHFFTIGQIKELLDLMAFYKLNRFHWHLTDDQGWRLEIMSYPKLTQVGAWRVPRIEFGSNTMPPQAGERATDGGFYTQAEVREIIRYASERYIEVVPEIDVPGHSMAAVAAYPELCVTRDTSIRVNPGSGFTKWFPKGGFEMYVDNTLNPTNERVYDFLDKVFGEVAALFPGKYIHIGGDECYKGFWEKDSSVQVFMKENNLKSSYALQSYFISRVNKIIQSKGKKLIGWDEILEGDPAENVTVMNRFGEKRAIEQTGKGLDIILAPGGNGFYFDYAQSTSEMEPSSHGGNAPLWKSYTFDPEYQSLSPDAKKHILGVEACIWTEHISSSSKLYYMILPRLLGLAQTAWSLQSNKSYQAFADHVLPVHLERFDKMGINFRVPTAINPIDTTIIDSSFTFKAKIPLAGAKVYFTLNNRPPSEADHLYSKPVKINLSNGRKAVVQTLVITPSGRRSIITRTVIEASKQ